MRDDSVAAGVDDVSGVADVDLSSGAAGLQPTGLHTAVRTPRLLAADGDREPDRRDRDGGRSSVVAEPEDAHEVVGIAGWALHVGALSRAPISLVQAFVAGGLVLAAPMAALGLGHRLRGSERWALACMVLALLLLTLGLGHAGPSATFAPAALGAGVGTLSLLAVMLAAGVRGPRRAPALASLAGGLLYEAADLAIKGLTRLGVAGALHSPWLIVAGVTTAGVFFAFQRGLQTGRPVSVIALLTAATNAGAVLGGFLVFGDPVGRTPLLALTHVAAFALVGLAAWWLAPSQARLAS